ncbi:hypothetical protein SAMN02990966_03825 [Rhodospirillales bacterium URHD0017]|nr:hypothetical protein SAMN02990966_03825 [Rhodospirillales bacterium URHD0017]
MSGKIIEFPSRDTNRASLCRTPAPPRPDGQAVLRLQVARISALLEELEDLIGSADDRSSPHLRQARATVERTRRIVTSRTEATENDGDPQPDVDRSLLERMYRALNPVA